ncbi:hypothetical protein QYE73_19950 [Pseudomonas mosselii]|uniref:hypothetical protein n=1 Tax=Pseudomonas mosselii TaxID=78327 RepID=UPI00260FCEDC|nr:hypothetical protein [Pseudomonas mosselii]MDN4499563.1 hypothetical protein [Pseudomonas mosselii]
MVGVRGLTLFGQHFSRYRDQYVLIGGVASSLVMDEAGVSFRTTKDLDIVLVIEALDSQFVAAFWAFVHSGGYQIRQASTARPVFYRFQNPTDDTYPAQLELFSRTPDELDHPEHATLTPIPTDESVSSLSAILLDKGYYAFLLEGRRQSDTLSYIGAERLIPFKAKAWLDLSARKSAGEQVDSRNIRKHRNDIVMLTGLLTGEVVSLPTGIANDMTRFLRCLAEEELNLKAMGLRGSRESIIERLAIAFGIAPPVHHRY